MADLAWGFECQTFQPPAYPTVRQRYTGITGKVEFVAFDHRVYKGWEIQSFQPSSYRKLRQRALGIKGKSQFAIFKRWINSGWEIQSFQPPSFKNRQRYGALANQDRINMKVLPVVTVTATIIGKVTDSIGAQASFTTTATHT